ncbi:hypothetical protein ACO34A_20565 [Rhizobium sp. ACO-34A]|nr:hypothetical protein ACO34A_20565 [Rhizobium sp. ACO-34A]
MIIAAFLLCANVRHFLLLVLGGIAIGVAYQFAIIGSFGDVSWQATLPNTIAAVLASLAWVAIFSLIGKRVIDAVENRFPSSRLA